MVKDWTGPPVFLQWKSTPDNKTFILIVESPHAPQDALAWIGLVDGWVHTMKETHEKNIQEYEELLNSGKITPLRKK